MLIEVHWNEVLKLGRQVLRPFRVSPISGDSHIKVDNA